MRHSPLADEIKYYIARKKILDTYIKANQDLLKKLLDLLGKINDLIQDYNIGQDLRTEILEEINRTETSIGISINERSFFEGRINTLLAA